MGMTKLEKAIQITSQAHAGQTRMDGTPYILHSIRVMMAQTDEECMIAAILHDVIEDTNVKMIELVAASFSIPVLQAIDLLTHKKEVSYQEYIDGIANNRIALNVKLADLEDNFDVRRLPVMEEADHARIDRYYKAWKQLSVRKSWGV